MKLIWRILFCVFILQFVIHKYFRLSNVLVKLLFVNCLCLERLHR